MIGRFTKSESAVKRAGVGVGVCSERMHGSAATAGVAEMHLVGELGVVCVEITISLTISLL